MENLDFIASIYFALTQNGSIEHRITSALDKVAQFFDINLASIALVSKNRIFYILGKNNNLQLKTDFRHELIRGKESTKYDMPWLQRSHKKGHLLTPENYEFNLGIIKLTTENSGYPHSSKELNEEFTAFLRLESIPGRSKLKDCDIETVKRIIIPIKAAMNQATYCRNA
jgi:hypothetical protein